MAEQFIQLPSDGAGKKVRTFEQTVGANVVEHQAFVLCDSSSNIIGSLASAPVGTEQGLVTRNIPSGTQAVSLASAPSTPVTGTFWQSTQPVSLATNTPDVTDRAARLLGLVGLTGNAGTANAYTLNLTTAPPVPNTANATNSVATSNVAAFGNATITLSGTFTGSPVVVFEQSDDSGTTWFPLQCNRNNDGTVVIGDTMVAGALRLYDAACAGITHIRVRMTTIPASGSVVVRINIGGTLSEPVAAVTNSFPLSQQIDGVGNPQAFQFAYFNVATAQTGVSLVAAPAAGRSIRVISYAIVVGAAMNVSLIGASTTLLFALAANGGVSFSGTLQGPAFQVAAATALTYTTSAIGQATGHICYVVV